MDEEHRLVKSLLAILHEHSMIAPGETVLVAVSGGPDSVALAHSLWLLREKLGISLCIAHLNHSFRGKESDEDAEFVRLFASSLGVPCVIEKIDVPRVRETLRLSAESTARLVRYEFLENTADKVGASKIALGHTADDQVETILMNIIRGSGLEGLAGMPAVRGRIIRPLLNVRRIDVASYLQQHGLSSRIDETNLLPHYTRNRVRLKLLPMLREYNPNVDNVILQLAELARADSAYMTEKAKESLEKLCLDRDEHTIRLQAKGLLGTHLALRRRVVREVFRMLRGELTDLGFKHVEELLALVDSGKSFQYELPAGVFVECEQGILTVRSERPAEIAITYKYELAIPGETVIPEASVSIQAEVMESRVEPVRTRDNLEVVLDLDRIRGPIVARNWQPGDRVRPLGMRGSKKLQDVFTDEKIPRRVRHRIPVVLDSDKIIWVVGLVVSDEVKVTEGTQRCLHMRAIPLSGCDYRRKMV